MLGTFLFLGTGASAGVPVIGCKCCVCSSTSPYNRRLRPSGLLRIQNKSFLLDVSPDFRQQALRHGIDHLDGILLTHTHYDHIAGIDELRIYYVRQKQALPCLLSQESCDDLKLRYSYLFRAPGKTSSLSAKIDLSVLPEAAGEIVFLGLQFRYFSYFQGGMKVTGYRIGDFAYVSDIRDYDESVFSALKGVRNLALSALHQAASPLHLSLNEAVAFARRVGASSTWLTHMSHTIDFETANATLPSDVQLAYDGLEVQFGF